MKLCIALFVYLFNFGFSGYCQNSFPLFDRNSLISDNYDLQQINKPYTVVVYGGVGCGYSKFLIQNLNTLDDIRDKADIVLIMDQPKDSITMHMNQIIDLYPVFTNTLLQYKLKKKNDIFPQLLLFKNQMQVEHIIGVKEGMLTKIRDMVLNDK
jgi:hypothetical protein